MGSACAKQDKGSVQELPKGGAKKNKNKELNSGAPRPEEKKQDEQWRESVNTLNTQQTGKESEVEQEETPVKRADPATIEEDEPLEVEPRENKMQAALKEAFTKPIINEVAKQVLEGVQSAPKPEQNEEIDEDLVDAVA